MDRFAARVATEYGDDVVVKGGVVLELRLAEARSTKALDLRLVGTSQHTLTRLQRSGRLDLGDPLSFEVQAEFASERPARNRTSNEGSNDRRRVGLAEDGDDLFICEVRAGLDGDSGPGPDLV